MKTSIQSLIISILICLMLFSQKGNAQHNVEGGPCSYETTILPATIIKVEVFDSTAAEITFVVAYQAGTDTLSYYSEFKKFATKQIIDEFDLKVGNSVCFESHDISSGSCSPHYTRLTLKKYIKPE